MRLKALLLPLIFGCAGGILHGQNAVPASHRYFRVIALGHLTGSGPKGDPIVPEYVKDGMAAAQAGTDAAVSRALSLKAAESTEKDRDDSRPAPTKAFLVSRPGIIAWGMQPSDDGKMAILQVVAVDRHAFDAILSDKRPEIRVFEIGKVSKDSIETEMREFKRDFKLDEFRVLAQ